MTPTMKPHRLRSMHPWMAADSSAAHGQSTSGAWATAASCVQLERVGLIVSLVIHRLCPCIQLSEYMSTDRIDITYFLKSYFIRLKKNQILEMNLDTC